MRAWASLSKSIRIGRPNRSRNRRRLKLHRGHRTCRFGSVCCHDGRGVIIASVFVVVIESVAARFTAPADSWIRTTWSLSQLAIGLFAALGCYIFNFLAIVADDAEVGLLDLLLKPLKLWGRALEHLPARLWVVNTAVSGVTAAVLSVLVLAAFRTIGSGIGA
jgi:hypothetical protein